VVTDGEDNVSRNSLEKAVREIQKSNVVIYSIGLFSDEDKKNRKKAMRALKDISAASGGVAFFLVLPVVPSVYCCGYRERLIADV